MLLGGLQKTTLIDYPGKVACTVFTVGCNFRCPFCHNRELVTVELFKASGLQPVIQEDFFKFLETRKKLLDGVCITGGEPTIQLDLQEFLQKIKNLGLLVKLDTNGSRPEVLDKLFRVKLIDYVAMDLKGEFGNYNQAIGKKTDIEKIKKSIRIILKSGIDYEFRTTLVPGIHNLNNLLKLAKELKQFGTDIIWFWQEFKPQNCLDEKFLTRKPFAKKELEDWLVKVKKILPQTRLRNLD